MDISKEPTKTSGKGCLILFGLVFFLAGLGVGLGSLNSVIKSKAALKWTQVEAKVLDAELKVSRGDDSDTYRATGNFTYIWNGEEYYSERVFVGNSSDSNRKFHNKIVSEMMANKSGQKELLAYVNPKKPEQAILYPQIRWGKYGMLGIFSLLFGGVGAAIIAGGQYAGKSIERENKRKILHPDRPWLWKDEWQTAAIKNTGKIVFYVALGFTLVWNLISAPLLFVLPEEIFEKRNYPAAFGLLFPIIGVGLAIWTFNTYRRWKRFGDASFVLDTFPAALGHVLQGKLTFKEHLPEDTMFEVKLSSIYKYKTGSGDNRRTVEDIKWQDEQHIPMKAGRHSDGYALPIRFKLPSDQHPSAWDDSDRSYLWKLSVISEQDGADFVQDFELPVFDPKDYNIRIPASAQFDENTAVTDIYTYKGDWQNTGVQAFEMAGGHAYYFKAARHKMTGVFLTLMTLMFGAIGVAPFFSDMPFFFGLIFGGFALLMGWLACIIWLYKTQIEVFPGTMNVRGGMFGGAYKTVDSKDITDIEMKSTMTSGTVKYYDIIAKTRSGENIKMAIHLVGKRDVQALIEQLRSDLGMTKTPEGQ